jgi:hypothetical protein
MRAKLAFVTRISVADVTLWATGGKPHKLPTADDVFIQEFPVTQMNKPVQIDGWSASGIASSPHLKISGEQAVDLSR